MKKILGFSLLLTSILFSATPVHDSMDVRLKGQSFGGTTGDNLAAEDGLGSVTVQHYSGTRDINNELSIQKVFNRVLNSTNDTSLTNNLNTSIKSGLAGTAEDLNQLSTFGFQVNVDGDSCDDDDPNTIGDVIFNGVCTGIAYDTLSVFNPSTNTLPYASLTDGTDPTFSNYNFTNMINNNTWWNYYTTVDTGERFGIIDMGSMTYFDNFTIYPSSGRNFTSIDIYVGNDLNSLTKVVSSFPLSSASVIVNVNASGRYIKFHGHGTVSGLQPAIVFRNFYYKKY